MMIQNWLKFKNDHSKFVMLQAATSFWSSVTSFQLVWVSLLKQENYHHYSFLHMDIAMDTDDDDDDLKSKIHPGRKLVRVRESHLQHTPPCS